jgi:hypothetical protein
MRFINDHFFVDLSDDLAYCQFAGFLSGFSTLSLINEFKILIFCLFFLMEIYKNVFFYV